jgi:hypothetical protein
MIRTLRAFVWLRWRMFVNSLENTSARNAVERFSLAIERIGPIIALMLMVPSGLALGAMSAAAGYSLASGNQHSLLFEAIRYLLIAVPILSIVGPLIMPAADRTNPVRLLLLPISRGTMYLAQTAGTFADPWMLLMMPILLGVAIGLAAGGAWAAAVFSALAGALLMTLVLGLSSLATSALHLAVRDRRRGEILALLFILIMPAISILPGLLESGTRRGRHTPAAAERGAPRWATRAAERGFSYFPTELYAGAARTAARHEAQQAAWPIVELAVMAAGLHGLALLAFAKVLASPESTGARRSAASSELWGRTLPGLSAAASAVALAQLRLALRTTRGRSILLFPLVLLVMFGVVMSRNLSRMNLGAVHISGGLGLASFASFICLLSILPIAMNQFAVDRAGLTLALLSPLADREYLTGKAVGNALITAGPVAVCTLISLAVFRDGDVALWLSLPLGLVSITLVVAPVAAMLSAVFPRAVNLNSIGRGSNAHGVAGFLGMLSFFAAGIPCALIVLGARLIGQIALTPVFLFVWCAIAWGLSRVLFIPAERIFAGRKENLAMINR